MKRITKSTAAGLATLAIVTAVGLTTPRATLAATTEADDTANGPDQDLVARGEYIVTTSGCNDCHTPMMMGPDGPEPDMSRMLSGHPQDLAMPPVPALPEGGPWLVIWAATNTAIAGPWGVSFTRNLTPDEETGIGEWSLKDFKDTLRTGRRMGRGREILPPMPIPMYKHFVDEDLEAIYAYLRTIPAVSNEVPEPWDPPAQNSASTQ